MGPLIGNQDARYFGPRGQPMVADRTTMAIIWLIATAGCAVTTYGFMPGIMISDSVDMFNRAQSLEFADWHSPTMQAIWAVMHRLIPGVLGMLLLLHAAYWAGFALIATGLARNGSPTLGMAVMALALFPTSLHMTSAVMKDTLMAAFFLLAIGFMVLSITARRRMIPLISAAIFLCLGIAMRPNAFAGAFPLIGLWIVCALPDRKLTWKTWVVSAPAAVFLYVGITQLERVALNPIPSNVDRSFMIFDLGGITYFSGEDQYDGLLGPGFVERNANSCYKGTSADLYIWHECKDVGALIEQTWTHAR